MPPLRPPAAAVTTLAASRKVHGAVEAGSSSRSGITSFVVRCRAGGFLVILCLRARARAFSLSL